jgi:hypothetical protein
MNLNVLLTLTVVLALSTVHAMDEEVWKARCKRLHEIRVQDLTKGYSSAKHNIESPIHFLDKVVAWSQNEITTSEEELAKRLNAVLAQHHKEILTLASEFKRTMLHSAVDYQCLYPTIAQKVIRILCHAARNQASKFILQFDYWATSAFDYALIMSYPDTVQTFLTILGDDALKLTEKPVWISSILHKAAEHGPIENVQAILDIRGLDIQTLLKTTDNNGYTPLKLAQKYSSEDIVNLLQKYMTQDDAAETKNNQIPVSNQPQKVATGIMTENSEQSFVSIPMDETMPNANSSTRASTSPNTSAQDSNVFTDLISSIRGLGKFMWPTH